MKKYIFLILLFPYLVHADLNSIRDTYKEDIIGTTQKEADVVWLKYLLAKYEIDGDFQVFHYLQKEAKDNAQMNMGKLYAGAISVKEFYNLLLEDSARTYCEALSNAGLIDLPRNYYLQYGELAMEALKALDESVGLEPLIITDKELSKLCYARSLIWYKFIDSVHLDFGLPLVRHHIFFSSECEKNASDDDKDIYELDLRDREYYENLVK
jgi:hypothetical protein